MTQEEIIDRLADIIEHVQSGIPKINDYGDYCELSERDLGRGDALISIQSYLVRLYGDIIGVTREED